jgi:hypothetical protein
LAARIVSETNHFRYMYGPVSFAIKFVDQGKHFTGGEVRVNFAIQT